MEGFWKGIDDVVSAISIDELHRFGVPDFVVKRLISFDFEGVRAPTNINVGPADCSSEEKRWQQ